MEENRARWIHSFLGATIVEAIKHGFILIFASTAFTFVLRVLSEGLAIRNEHRWFICILLGCLAGYIALRAYERFSRLQPRLPRIDADFVVTRAEVTYVYHQDKHIQFRKKKELKALKTGLSKYIDRYHWTGAGSVHLKSVVRGQDLVLSDKKNVWQFYEIEFGRPLNKGEIIETEVVWEIDDSSDTSAPMVGYTIEEPTDELKIKLRFPPEFEALEITSGVHLGLGSTRPFRSGTIPMNRDGSADWHLKRPDLLHHYELRWRFPHRAKRTVDNGGDPG